MNRVVNFLQKYFAVISVLIGISILLSVTFSSYIVTSNNHKAAEMYIGELQYSMEIDGSSTNTLTVPTGETIVDVKVNNLNPVDTYYKLLYLNNSNLEIKYFSETKDTDDVVTTYNKPNDSVTSSNSNTIKLLIINNSTSSQNIALTMKGGYITNTIQDITTPSTYREITLVETPSTNTYFCKTNDTLTQGLKYTNGQYIYSYKQEGSDVNSASFYCWNDISNDGWGVRLTDEYITDTIASKLCTYINNKPLISMSYTFRNSQATAIELDNINTSNIINMKGLFSGSQTAALDLSNFDTSNVIDMSSMFTNSSVLSLNLDSFNTSKVENMNNMFYGAKATTINVSKFDTSKVTNMSRMFSLTKATTLDINNFDTSKVTNMEGMFYGAKATTLDVSNFDTSNVTYMGSMFYGVKVTTLDISKFDTLNVTNMGWMFNNATNLKTIYVSNKFNTDNVTTSTNMFKETTNLVGGAGTTYNSSYIDKTYARIDGGTSSPGYFTDIADKDIPVPNSFATDSWKTIIKAVGNNNISKYNVGDTRTIDMGTYGTHTLRIANTSTPSECSTSGFSQTACGFVLEFADVITMHNMNPEGNYNGTQYSNVWNKDGWPLSSLNSFINNDIYNALPSDLRTGIINTTMVSSHGNEDTSNFTSTDKLYLLSTAEVYAQGTSNTIDYDTARNVTRQLDYYKNLNTTTNNYSAALKYNGSDKKTWWTRSACSDSNYTFYRFNIQGNWRQALAYSEGGVSPAFRIS